jgi:hypothetical protein
MDDADETEHKDFIYLIQLKQTYMTQFRKVSDFEDVLVSLRLTKIAHG